MFEEMKINGMMLPRPDDDLTFKNEKKKTEFQSEAGTTLVSVSRVSRITISGNWTLTGAWMKRFRDWAASDTVMVSCFFPEKDRLTEHECQLEITSERHIRRSRDQLNVEGLYKISVAMEEL